MKNLLFYYPQHFNRSEAGTNPYFDRMLEICDKHGISYDLMEEPDGGTDKPRNSNAQKGDAFFWTITAIRKILSKTLPNKTFFEREKLVARIFNVLTFGRYRYRKYITISGSMYHLFANLNPDADVYDMQHGILYKQHPTFFENRRLCQQFYKSNLHFLFWGKGYEDNFIKDDESVLQGRTHVIGYPVLSKTRTRGSQNRERKIVVSLQFTHDLSEPDLKLDKEVLDDFLSETENSGYKVMLKHHPRFNNVINIDELLNRYNHVELTNKPLEELISEVQLHVTYFSTTAFEYAAYGIPTYFLPSHGRPMYSLFYSEYNYPLYENMSVSEVLTRLQDAEPAAEDSSKVTNWYHRFYSPFDEEAFLNLIK